MHWNICDPLLVNSINAFLYMDGMQEVQFCFCVAVCLCICLCELLSLTFFDHKMEPETKTPRSVAGSMPGRHNDWAKLCVSAVSL